MDTKYLKFVFYLKKKSVNIKTIGQRAGMTDGRIRVTKVFEAVNKKMIRKEKQKMKEVTEKVKQNGF